MAYFPCGAAGAARLAARQRDAVTRQHIAQLAILLRRRNIGDVLRQHLADACELQALIDDLLALTDIDLDRLIAQHQTGIDDDQDRG